jgi:two-component system, chemotaxis family, CheB/CheR fusion protein
VKTAGHRSAGPTAAKRSSGAERGKETRAPGRTRSFPIVGIGASAGGLDAFRSLFAAMPADSGAAFVLIQHLDPTRESLAAELIGSYTSMRVVQAADGMRLQPNHVYVIPPNAYLAVAAGRLQLSPPTAPRSLRMAVDFFLRSLAADQAENAIGVILSGTGSDGTLGLKEIKAAGGMTMVEDPKTARHDGMPRSALHSADYVVRADEMAEVMIAYLRHAAAAASDVHEADEVPDALARVIALLHSHTKFDFGGYKKGTLRRRIQRRMSLRHCEKMSEYVKLLGREPAEVDALFKDLLINVTHFFREPSAWEALQSQAIRGLVAGKPAGATIRAWVPACATGEEAYSLVIALIEEIQAAGKDCRLQVFASDVDTDALEVARAGLYPEGIAAHVSPERLAGFFTKVGHLYRVRKELRDAIVFAQQSLISDPPFSKLDLVSCRNLFIYLEAPVQDRLIPVLHFSLLEGGTLFLGSAEGIRLQVDLFEPISAKWRIYRRIGRTRYDRLQFPTSSLRSSAMERARSMAWPSSSPLPSVAQQLLLRRYAPTCVIVNRAGEILYFHGRTDDYLAQPSGPPTQSLVAQTRDGLRAKLGSALQSSIVDKQRVVARGIRVRRGRTFVKATISVEPLEDGSAETGDFWLVSFEDDAKTSARKAAQASIVSSEGDPSQLEQLEYELKSTQHDLQQTIEDVRAANEQLMSLNEELQASNEELETSQEELQSLNEELTTANAQLESKISEVEFVNNDLDNLLTSTNIPTLFLDANHRIRRYTPSATRLFSLIASDIGRPIADIAQRFNDPELLADIDLVLHQPVAPRTEVQGHDGTWYVRQVLPYRTRDERTEGSVVTFSDVAAEALQEARLYAESIVDTLRQPLLVLDGDLRVRSANRAFYATFDLSSADTAGRLLYELGDREWDIPELRRLLGDVLPRQHVVNDLELRPTFPSTGTRVVLLNARAIERAGGRPYLILLAIEDITERLGAEEALRRVEERKNAEQQMGQKQAQLAHALRISTVGELASGLAHELNQPLSAIANGVEACARYLRAGKAKPEKLLALLDDASAEALRAGSIVEHLRGFIVKGQPKLERTDLREIARNVPLLLGRELLQANITLRLHLHGRPLPIYADRIQIEQIIVNLMQNAIDAHREAPGSRQEIELHVRAVRGKAEVAVRDHGAGVSAEAAERMFEPFFTTKSAGLGMGLAISRSILEAHRGRIWVVPSSQRRSGTTVCFTLPLRAARPPRKKKRRA